MNTTDPKPGFVQLDGRKLYHQVLVTRNVLGMTWPQVWEKSGVGKASLDRLKRGAMVEASTMLRLMTWLGVLHIGHFTKMEDDNDKS